MKNKNVSTLNVILTLLILVQTIIIGFLYIKNKKISQNQIIFSAGEPLPALELLNLDNTPQETDTFAEGVTVLFIFKTPCSACNSNLGSWNKITKFFGNRIKVMGIIPDGDPAAFQLVDEKRVNFSLYVPADQNTLREQLRLRLNIAQTMVVVDNKVMTSKIGILSPEDLQSLVFGLKKIISSSGKNISKP